jgi:hypothetical protein
VVTLLPLLIPFLILMFEFIKPFVKIVANNQALQSHSCPELSFFPPSRVN